MDEYSLCLRCFKDFNFSKKEQEWYDRMDYDYPLYCPACRQQRKLDREKKDLIAAMGGNGQFRRPLIYGGYEVGGFR